MPVRRHCSFEVSGAYLEVPLPLLSCAGVDGTGLARACRLTSREGVVHRPMAEQVGVGQREWPDIPRRTGERGVAA
jgi:hypothetical protein